MKQEQIKEIIENYSKLTDLAESKIKLMESLDYKYNTARRIEEIDIYLNTVCVRCDDSFRGSYDYFIFEFPTDWLSKSDSELEEIILNEKKLREEKELREKEEKLLREVRDKELNELEQYKKLKAKFEGTKIN